LDGTAVFVMDALSDLLRVVRIDGAFFITERKLLRKLLDGEAVELIRGDVLVFPHGDAHLISS
jgi:hypothetical protein